MIRLIFFLIPVIVFGQIDLKQNGVVQDHLIVKDSAETFAIYIPESIKQNKSIPCIFIFDPLGRGKVGIQPFIESSEKYGIALICSNNSRNAPYAVNFQIFNRLYTEITSQLSVDEGQLFVAGFSGGSRLASSIAILSDKMQGVIACGAGFSNNDLQLPLLKNQFRYAGIVGDRDMNFQELFKYEKLIERLGHKAEIFTYNGDHSWPPSSQITKAMDWLFVMQGANKMTPEQLETSYQAAYALAQEKEIENNLLAAKRDYTRLITSYSSFFNTDSIASRMAAVKNSKEYKNQLKVSEKIQKEEEEWMNFFSDRFFLSINKTEVDYSWWTKSFKKFEKKYSDDTSVAFQNMKERISYFIYAMLIENASIYRNQNLFTKAIHAHRILVLYYPKKPFPLYLLAQDYASSGKSDLALQTLQLCIDIGFNDAHRLSTDTAFNLLRNNETFEQMILNIKTQ